MYVMHTYPPKDIPVPTRGASGNRFFTCATTLPRSSLLAAQYVRAVYKMKSILRIFLLIDIFLIYGTETICIVFEGLGELLIFFYFWGVGAAFLFFLFFCILCFCYLDPTFNCIWNFVWLSVAKCLAFFFLSFLFVLRSFFYCFTSFVNNSKEEG